LPGAERGDTREPRPSAPTLIPFFGRGPDYLRTALRSAADFNDRVVLVGDESNRGFWTDHWDSSRAGLPRLDEFRRTYVKMSDYPEFYETAFWRRPFAVEAWMRAEGVGHAFVLDSDTVTFADYSTTVLPALPDGCAAAMMTFHEQGSFDWASSFHFSYWTLEALADFNAFCIEAYRDPVLRGRLETKYRWHLDNRRPGGICEMTLLYLWRERHEARTWNPARVWDGMVADSAITTPDNYFRDEYVMRRGFKKLVFRKGLPYGLNRVLGREVRFVNVQCQGGAKALMRLLYAPGWQRLYADVHALRRMIGKARIRSSIRAALGVFRRPGSRGVSGRSPSRP
jgi:hypothetical protein